MSRSRIADEVLIDALRGWVAAMYQRRWAWCATLPSPTPIRAYRARELFEAWHARLKQHVEGMVPAVSVLELNGVGVVRIHALLAGVESLQYTTGTKEWQELTGAAATLFAFDPKRARQCVLDIPAGNTLLLGEIKVRRARRLPG